MSITRGPWADDKRTNDDNNGGNSSGGGGDMETRVAVLEANVGHIKTELSDIKQSLNAIRSDATTHFRWMIGIAVTLAVVGFGAITSLNTSVSAVHGDVRELKGAAQGIDKRLAVVETNSVQTNDRVNQVERKIDQLDHRTSGIEDTLKEIKQAVTK